MPTTKHPILVAADNLKKAAMVTAMSRGRREIHFFNSEKKGSALLVYASAREAFIKAIREADFEHDFFNTVLTKETSQATDLSSIEGFDEDWLLPLVSSFEAGISSVTFPTRK